MNIKDLVKKWFELWEKGDFTALPLAGNLPNPINCLFPNPKSGYLSQ